MLNLSTIESIMTIIAGLAAIIGVFAAWLSKKLNNRKEITSLQLEIQFLKAANEENKEDIKDLEKRIFDHIADSLSQKRHPAN